MAIKISKTDAFEKSEDSYRRGNRHDWNSLARSLDKQIKTKNKQTNKIFEDERESVSRASLNI